MTDFSEFPFPEFHCVIQRFAQKEIRFPVVPGIRIGENSNRFGEIDFSHRE
jgi:hypothetical protein